VDNDDTNDYDSDKGACASRITGVELDSLISSVLDLLPDLGGGFIKLCLEEYNYNVERVVNALLEDKLLPALQDIDRWEVLKCSDVASIFGLGRLISTEV